ncbi:MAG: ABC transporter ATP-binding protein [Acidobacteria bacterium]|nr:ABC transporter ATP-binding protein [Acidobacteriota bacterium]
MVTFDSVSKSYPIYNSPGDRLRELLLLNRRSFHRDFWALRDVSFSIDRGSTFCIIGENGSGKSTLLQLVAGIFPATRGRVEIGGRVSALLELGSGFNPEFSGRDNVYLNGTLLGLSTREIDRRYGAIEEFAEIGDFINQPVKTYSSGMVVRLAFAVAINVDPEILLVDEALAVGDVYFRQRCMRKVHELRSRQVTILFVSHSMGDVKAVGDRALWLDAGRVVAIGPPEAVVSKYLARMVEKDAAYLKLKDREARSAGSAPVVAPEVAESIPNIDFRYGNKHAEVIGIAVLDPAGAPASLVEPCTQIVVRISVRARAPIPSPMVGFMMRNHLGIDFSGTNTAREGFHLPPMTPGDIFTVDFHLTLPELYPSHFSFSPAIANGALTGYEMCDWIDNGVTVQMGPSDGEIYGYVRFPCRVELNSVLAARKDAIAR